MSEAIPPLGGYSEAALDQAFAELCARGRSLRAIAIKRGSSRAIPTAVAGPQAGPSQVNQRCLAQVCARRSQEAHRPAPSTSSKRKLSRVSTAPAARAVRLHSTPEAIDITLPGTRRTLGAEHPLIKTMHEMVAVFPAHGILCRCRSRGRNRLLQLRIAQLPARSSRSRHTGYFGRRESRAQAAARPPAHAHAHISGADPNDGAATATTAHRHPPARSTATTPPTPRTRPSSTRSKASALTPTSPSPTSRAHSTTP